MLLTPPNNFLVLFPVLFSRHIVISPFSIPIQATNTHRNKTASNHPTSYRKLERTAAPLEKLARVKAGQAEMTAEANGLRDCTVCKPALLLQVRSACGELGGCGRVLGEGLILG